MDSVPKDMSEEAVAKWLYDDAPKCVLYDFRHAKVHARAVRALVRAKVREAVRFCSYDDETDAHVDAIVSRVLGEEAPRA